MAGVPGNAGAASPGMLTERVLVLMPTLRDAERTTLLLQDASVRSTVCAGVAELCRELRDGAGVILLTDDALFGDSCGHLAEALREQPAWSAIPVLVVASEGRSYEIQRLASDAFSSLIIVERPVRTQSLLSVVQSALRARRHQYQIRDVIAVREEQAAKLLGMHEALRASEAELARQAEELRRAARRKDEFLATLAHELRNPLAPIRTGMELLTKSPDGAGAERTLGVMQRQVAHMVRLIDDLLDVSRITRGKLDLKRSRVNVTAIIDAAVEASRPLIERKQHTLRVNVKDASLCFDADLTRIGQVISNLLNNASNYTPPGGVIELSVGRDGEHALIEVRDNGSGIPSEHLDAVFEMFNQVNRTLERSQGGLGIGLALVRSLVEMHGGSVRAASAGPGLGSTFTVRLPISAQGAPEVGEADGPTPSRRSRLRILVVDDNEDAADLLAMMLAQAGYPSEAVYDGPSAIASVQASAPQVVILDIGLPGMSGYDVARALRQETRREPLALIALTGWGTNGDKRLAMEAGFDIHLTKPVDARNLYEVLARLEREPGPQRRAQAQ